MQLYASYLCCSKQYEAAVKLSRKGEVESVPDSARPLQLSPLPPVLKEPEELLASIEASYADFPELHIPSFPEVRHKDLSCSTRHSLSFSCHLRFAQLLINM